MKRTEANAIILFISIALLLTSTLCQTANTEKNAPGSEDQAEGWLDASPTTGGDDLAKESGYLVLVYKLGSNVVARDLKGDIIASGAAGTDDVAVIKSAIDFLAEGEVLCIGTFSIISTIDNLKSGIHLRGIPGKTVFDSSKISQDVFSLGAMGYDGSTTPLEEDVNAGAHTIEVEDATGYKEGDYVKLMDDDGILGFKKGELLRILKIKGKDITFTSSVRDSYSMEREPNIRRLAMCYDVTIEGIEFLGPGMDTDLNLFSGYLLKDFKFINNEVNSFGKAAVHLTDSLDCTLKGNTIEDVFMNGLGYSIVVYNACDNISITDNLFRHKGRHYIAAGGETGTRLSGGFCRNIEIRNNYFENSTEEAINTHPPFYGPINIIENTFVNCTKGVEISNGNTNIYLNTFKDCDIGIQLLGNEERDHNIHSNKFENCIYNISIQTDHMTIMNNLGEGRFHLTEGRIEFI